MFFVTMIHWASTKKKRKFQWRATFGTMIEAMILSLAHGLAVTLISEHMHDIAIILSHNVLIFNDLVYVIVI